MLFLMPGVLYAIMFLSVILVGKSWIIFKVLHFVSTSPFYIQRILNFHILFECTTVHRYWNRQMVWHAIKKWLGEIQIYLIVNYNPGNVLCMYQLIKISQKSMRFLSNPLYRWGQGICPKSELMCETGIKSQEIWPRTYS